MFSNNSEIFNNIYSELFLVNIFSKTLQNVPIIWNLLYSIESEIFYQFLRTNLNFSLKHSEICKVFNIIEKTIAGPTLCAQLMGRAQLSRPLPPSARPSGPFCDAIDLKSLKATNRRPPSNSLCFRHPTADRWVLSSVSVCWYKSRARCMELCLFSLQTSHVGLPCWSKITPWEMLRLPLSVQTCASPSSQVRSLESSEGRRTEKGNAVTHQCASRRLRLDHSDELTPSPHGDW